MTRLLGLAGLLVILWAPPALALDVLPSESRLGDEQALLVVRSDGPLVVRAEPPVLVASGHDDLEPTPRALEPRGSWRGMDDVVLVQLERRDASQTTQIFLEDDGPTGAWIEWPGAASAVASAKAQRTVPGAAGLVPTGGLLAAAALMRRRAAGRACGTR